MITSVEVDPMTEDPPSTHSKKERCVRFATASSVVPQDDNDGNVEEGGGGGGSDSSLIIFPPVLEDSYEGPHANDMSDDEKAELWLQPVDYFTIYVDYSEVVDRVLGKATAGGKEGDHQQNSHFASWLLNPIHRLYQLRRLSRNAVNCRRRNCPIARLRRHYYIH